MTTSTTPQHTAGPPENSTTSGDINLERHNCLGELTRIERSKQVAEFMSEERADRQLLVALHELTQGIPFEKIVLDEYDRVPEKARRLYLDIATMHQFAVPVRAGTISRVSGIRFRDYEQEFFEPLKDMVTVVHYLVPGIRPNLRQLARPT